MTWKRGPTLAGRGAAPASTVQPAAPPSTRTTSAPRHCWVTDLPDLPGRWPGLLVEWRAEAGQWVGRVVYAVDDAGRSVLVETWVPARHLHPA